MPEWLKQSMLLRAGAHTGVSLSKDSLRSQSVLQSRSLYTREPGMLPHQRDLPFSTIFLCRQTQPIRQPRRGLNVSPKGKAKPLKKTACFLRGLPPTLAHRRGCRRQKLRPGFAGKGTPFLQYPGRPAGDSGGFWIFGRYPNWTFRDSGHFCPRKIRLRPLLLFETGRIQTATVAQLGQE